MKVIERWRSHLAQWWLRFRCPSEFLCDNCKYDRPSACRHGLRPNAVTCPDYRPNRQGRRGGGARE